MDTGCSVLWPEKESYLDLRTMRETRGKPAFDKEKQNEPWAEDSAVFAGLGLRFFDYLNGQLECDPPAGNAWVKPLDFVAPLVKDEDLKFYGFLDPSLGKTNGDYASIVTVGVDTFGYCFAVDAWIEHASPSQQIEKIFELNDRWHYTVFGVETNGFQAVLMEGFEARRQVRRSENKSWMIPITQVRQTASKNDRIIALEPLVRNGWLLFNRQLPLSLFDQLDEFPTGSHDDAPDALASCVALAQKGSGQEKHQSTDRESTGQMQAFGRTGRHGSCRLPERKF